MIRTIFNPPDDLPQMSLIIKDGKLIMLDWHNDKTDKLFKKLGGGALDVPTDKLNQHDPNHAIALLTIAELEAYFAGRLTSFSVPLDLSTGTKFQQTVWRALLTIPYGQTISYATLAQNIGKPTAYRACANANGKNPISLIIPCHRVIASDGGLGGYTGGLDIKRALLKLERTPS